MHKTKRVAVVLALMGTACAARAVKKKVPLIETNSAVFVEPAQTKRIVEAKSPKKASKKPGARPVSQILEDFKHNEKRFGAMYELLDHKLSLLEGRDSDRVRDAALEAMKIDSDVLVPGIRILGEIADPSTVYEIDKLSVKADSKVRFEAAKSLGNIKSRDSVMLLEYFMGDRDLDVGRVAVDSLAKIGPFAAPYIVSYLTPGSVDRSYAAVEALSRMGPEAVGEVAPYVYHKDNRAAYHAITVLGNIDDKSALKHLHWALSHPDNNVRGTAANALRKIGDKSSIAQLSKLAKSDPSDFVRAAAEFAVKELSK